MAWESNVSTTSERRAWSEKVFMERYGPLIGAAANAATTIRLAPAQVSYAEDVGGAIARHKIGGLGGIGDAHYQNDKVNLDRRNFAGIIGQMGVYAFLGLDPMVVDASLSSSYDAHYPDLSPLGIRAGVKCSSASDHNLPVVFMRPRWPEIISLYERDADEAVVYLLGIADEEVQASGSSVQYCVNADLHRRGTKAGFFAVSRLAPIAGHTIKSLASAYPVPKT